MISASHGRLAPFAILRWALALGGCWAGTAALAEDAPALLPDWLAIHGQGTLVLQGTPGFSSPYVGGNSLTPHQRKETIDATLYAGLRPWAGGELWVNP